MFRSKLVAVIIACCTVSCGGGGASNATSQEKEPEVFTGIFLDSAVEGMSYTTASNSGTTNVRGEFSYQSNESVTFSI